MYSQCDLSRSTYCQVRIAHWMAVMLQGHCSAESLLWSCTALIDKPTHTSSSQWSEGQCELLVSQERLEHILPNSHWSSMFGAGCISGCWRSGRRRRTQGCRCLSPPTEYHSTPGQEPCQFNPTRPSTHLPRTRRRGWGSRPLNLTWRHGLFFKSTCDREPIVTGEKDWTTWHRIFLKINMAIANIARLDMGIS